jgi:hypothetical protein
MGLGAALALTTLSGALYGLAFPPVGWWPLAWVALVPFSSRSRRGTACARAGLGIWLGIVASYAVGTWIAGCGRQLLPAVDRRRRAAVFLACALWQAAWQYAGFALFVRRVGVGGAVTRRC